MIFFCAAIAWAWGLSTQEALLEGEIRHKLSEDFRRKAGQRRPAVALADQAETAPRAEASDVFLAFELSDEPLEVAAHDRDVAAGEPRLEVVVAEAQRDVPAVNCELAHGRGRPAPTHGAQEKLLGIA